MLDWAVRVCTRRFADPEAMTRWGLGGLGEGSGRGSWGKRTARLSLYRPRGAVFDRAVCSGRYGAGPQPRRSVYTAVCAAAICRQIAAARRDEHPPNTARLSSKTRHRDSRSPPPSPQTVRRRLPPGRPSPQLQRQPRRRCLFEFVGRLL